MGNLINSIKFRKSVYELIHSNFALPFFIDVYSSHLLWSAEDTVDALWGVTGNAPFSWTSIALFGVSYIRCTVSWCLILRWWDVTSIHGQSVLLEESFYMSWVMTECPTCANIELRNGKSLGPPHRGAYDPFSLELPQHGTEAMLCTSWHVTAFINSTKPRPARGDRLSA